MALHFPKIDLSSYFHTLTLARVRQTIKATALHPYLRLFVLLSTFCALFSAVIIKDDQLPELTSPQGGPSGDRAWADLLFLTKRPHPFNTRRNDVVREFILAEMKDGTLPFAGHV